MMMVQHLWTWTMWVYTDSLETAIFAGKRGIGLLNAGYGPSSHSQDRHIPGPTPLQQPVASGFGGKNSSESTIVILASPELPPLMLS